MISIMRGSATTLVFVAALEAFAKDINKALGFAFVAATLLLAAQYGWWGRGQ